MKDSQKSTKDATASDVEAIVIMPDYALQRKTINTYVRHELRQNMTNLPERWQEIAISKDIEQLKKHAVSGDRIINRDTLEVQKAL